MYFLTDNLISLLFADFLPSVVLLFCVFYLEFHFNLCCPVFFASPFNFFTLHKNLTSSKINTHIKKLTKKHHFNSESLKSGHLYITAFTAEQNEQNKYLLQLYVLVLHSSLSEEMDAKSTNAEAYLYEAKVEGWGR